MSFDYKKEYKEFYLPPRTPGIVTVPAMNFLAVRGRGDPMRRAAPTGKLSVCSMQWPSPSK